MEPPIEVVQSLAWVLFMLFRCTTLFKSWRSSMCQCINFIFRSSQKLSVYSKNHEFVVSCNVEGKSNTMWSSLQFNPKRETSYLLMCCIGSHSPLYSGIALSTTFLRIFTLTNEGIKGPNALSVKLVITAPFYCLSLLLISSSTCVRFRMGWSASLVEHGWVIIKYKARSLCHVVTFRRKEWMLDVASCSGRGTRFWSYGGKF